MKSRQIDTGLSSTYILVMETGDEIVTELKKFAAAEQLDASSFKAIGALSDVAVGWFNWETKKYEIAAELHEQLEVLSLVGDIALYEGAPSIHAHIVIGKRDGTAHGGHLLHAHVRPTLEIVLTESPAHLQKQWNAEAGLPLIRP